MILISKFIVEMNTWYSPNVSKPHTPADLNPNLQNFDDSHFDVREFNKLFEDEQSKHYAEQQNKELTKLNKLTESQPTRKLFHQLTIGELLLNFKDNLFDLFDDLFFFRFNSIPTFLAVFIAGDRPFYLGMLILIIALIIYFLTPFPNLNEIAYTPVYLGLPKD